MSAVRITIHIMGYTPLTALAARGEGFGRNYIGVTQHLVVDSLEWHHM